MQCLLGNRKSFATNVQSFSGKRRVFGGNAKDLQANYSWGKTFVSLRNFAFVAKLLYIPQKT